MAIADGVDIISYSVGSSLNKITAPDDVALMAAAKAGILSVVAAGNEGPNLATIGSPAGGPWVITAAASTRDGESSVEAIQVSSPPSIAGKYASKEALFSPPLQDRDPIEDNSFWPMTVTILCPTAPRASRQTAVSLCSTVRMLQGISPCYSAPAACLPKWSGMPRTPGRWPH